jgi:hypothetical protein
MVDCRPHPQLQLQLQWQQPAFDSLWYPPWLPSVFYSIDVWDLDLDLDLQHHRHRHDEWAYHLFYS